MVHNCIHGAADCNNTADGPMHTANTIRWPNLIPGMGTSRAPANRGKSGK